MKKYIGTKHIEAEPMTMGEAFEKNLLQSGRVPNESEKNNAGYHVKYGVVMKVGHQPSRSRRLIN